MKKSLVLILLSITFVLASNISIETLDEQLSSNNNLVLRFKIHNDSAVLKNAILSYYLEKDPGKSIIVDKYYLDSISVEVQDIDSTISCINFIIPEISTGTFPNQSGFSVGIHYDDWSNRDKSRDFSKPASSSFSIANNVSLVVDDNLVYGNFHPILQEFYENHLPDATPISYFDGIGVVKRKGEPTQFAWNIVDNAEYYLLTVQNSSDSSIVHQKEYATNSATINLSEGSYFWSVKARNSTKTYSSSFIDRLKITLIRILYESVYSEFYRIGWPNDTIESSNGRKDTKLLNISWGEKILDKGWDIEHAPADPILRPLDEDEANRCWAIAIQELNHYYKTKNGQRGNLTLDEIVAVMHILQYWYAIDSDENKLDFLKNTIHGPNATILSLVDKTNKSNNPALTAFRLGNRNGGSNDFEAFWGLQWALNIPEPKLNETHKSVNSIDNAEDWKRILRSGKPVYVSVKDEKNAHAMILDGFRVRKSDNVTEFHFMNTTNHGNNEWWEFQGDNWLNLYGWLEIDVPTDVRLTDADVHTDSDFDGIMDFDELYRFDSSPFVYDTDNDGIDDKTEIMSYTIREDPYGKSWALSGVMKEKFADIDNDGFRAENDPDSDGDGFLDGEEDKKHNGILNDEESDPYVFDQTPIAGNYYTETNEIPEGINLYAFEYIRINDRVKCYNGSASSSNRCNIASEQKENTSVIIGVKARVGDIYSKGPVTIRNNASVHVVRYYAYPDHVYTVESQEGAECLGLTNKDESTWPYSIPRIRLPSNNSTIDTIVKSGETFTLEGTNSFRSLKVESGGKLYFKAGTTIIDNLQLDSGSEIEFSEPRSRTILHVNNKILWNAKIIDNVNDHMYLIALGFKLYYHGTETFDVAGNWCGTIIAPKARLVFGQNANKKIYGQFLAKSIVVHQFSIIYGYGFNPLTNTQPTDVAFLENRL